MATLCADISAIDQAKTAKNIAADNGFLLSESPDDSLNFHEYDIKCEKITVREILSLLRHIFGVTYTESKQRKPTLAKRLELELEINVKLFDYLVLICSKQLVPSVSGYNEAKQGDSITL